MIEIINLTKKYGDHKAVDNISMKIEKGQLFGLLGPNGAGKSTTVSMLSTVLTPTSGEIIINGMPLAKNEMKVKSIIGVVPQELALYDQLSTRDNLHFFGSLYRISGKKLSERVDEVLEIIGLKDRAKETVSKYSGGMKRRVNIGIALMQSPQILILDEPTVGIDPQSRNHILETIKTLNKKEGVTVIYTSHYMEEVEFLCDRIGIIDYGKLIGLGTIEELKNNIKACDVLNISYECKDKSIIESIKKVKGVSDVAEDRNALKILFYSQQRNVVDLVNELKNIGIPITSFQYEEVNLETVFLQMTGKSLRE